jgi:DNA-directed RNA polymerase specialized sigma24 family protein
VEYIINVIGVVTIDVFEINRRELVKMLQTYNEERKNISRLKELALIESEEELYPSATDYNREKIQKGEIDPCEGVIRKVEQSRKHLYATMRELDEKTKKLDKLILEITKMPAYLSRVIVSRYIDGMSESEIAEMMGRSEETISGYRKTALKRLTRVMFYTKIETWKKEAN